MDKRWTKRSYVGGIDEAGRGPLAGPVSVAMVVAPKGFRFWHPKLGRIKDSKKLTAKGRLLWYVFLTSHPKLSWVHSYVTCRVIDRVNVARAIDRGVKRLGIRCKPVPDFVFLDGSLHFTDAIPHKVVVKGDEKIPIVSAASIIAKVRRDRHMVKMAKKFPQYSFDVHKGYGTRRHIELIKSFGPSPLHRTTFIRSFVP
ncbi:MAG: ribonuclease HII [Candidatus Sungbacteria bacterium]|nr:ribonuclease HII [Candidatus Sungbacteria bacterium]